MKRPSFPLSTITSAGPQVLHVSDGSVYTKATPCRRCGEPIEAGERIGRLAPTGVPGGWQHKVCSIESLASVPASRAWLALAADAARRPRDYKTGQLREILDAVLRIAHGAEVDEHEAYVEALRHAHGQQLVDQGAGLDLDIDPHDFATRYSQYEWCWQDSDEERLAVEDAYAEYVITMEEVA